MMNKTICPACRQELNTSLRPDFMLCSDCGIAVRIPSTIPATPDRLSVYSEDWIRAHSRNPVALDVAKSLSVVVQETLGDDRTAKVLDIGCGSGVLVDKLSRTGYQAYGVDWSEQAIDFAGKNMQGKFTQGDIENWNYQTDDKFDLITASHILEHLVDPHSFLRSVAELLKPKGYLVIAIPNLNWYSPKSAWRSVSTLFDGEHVVGYTPKGLKKLLEGNGYQVVDMLTRTHRLAILTALGITVYGKLFSGKGNSPVKSGVKSGYVKATGEGMLAKVLAWGMAPLNRLSERGLRGMELLVVARKASK